MHPSSCTSWLTPLSRSGGVSASRAITLFLFSGISTLSRDASSAGEELRIAIAGPLTSFVIAAFWFMCWVGARASSARTAEAVAGYLALLTLMLGAFNLVPGFPLDGGRVLRAIVWQRRQDRQVATRIASGVGRGIAMLLVGAGLFAMVAVDLLSGLWLILIGWFLWGSAERNYREFLIEGTARSIPIAPFVHYDVPRVPPDLTLVQFAHDFLLPQQRRVYFVARSESGEICGTITLADLHRAPQRQWADRRVADVMTHRDRLVTVGPDADVLTALQLMRQYDINQILVGDDWCSPGLVSRGALLGSIQLREAVGAPG